MGETIDVPANKNIMLVAAAENIKIKRAAGFAGSLFTVSGGTFQIAGGTLTDTDGNATGTGSVTVDGTGDGTTAVTAPMVDVQSGTFGISDGTTLSGNANTSTDVNGGAVNVASGAAFYLLAELSQVTLQHRVELSMQPPALPYIFRAERSQAIPPHLAVVSTVKVQ